MGSDMDFVRTLLDTYKAGVNETVKTMNLEQLRDVLGDYDLSEAERSEINREIVDELKKLGVSVEEAVKEKEKADEIEAVEPEEMKFEIEAKLAELLVTFRCNPDGITEAIEEGISPELKGKLAAMIRARLEKTGVVEAIDFEKNVTSILDKCEAKEGVPMFRTRYAGERFGDPQNPGRYLVLFICYGRHWSQWLGNVSEDDIIKLEAK